MSGIEVLSRTQRIIVLPHTSVSIVKMGPAGPVGPKGELGPTGPKGLDGDLVGANLYVAKDGAPTTVATALDFTTAPTINGELLEAILMLAEDTAHVSGEQGLLGLAVRRDADTPLVDEDGDYSALLVDALGRLKVKTVKDAQIVSGSVGIVIDGSVASTGGDDGAGNISLVGKSLVGIQMPADWTAAVLSFQGSMDGGTTFNNLYDDAGTERVVVVTAARSVTLDPMKFMGLTHIKFRSGTSAGAVVQVAARTILYTTIAL